MPCAPQWCTICCVNTYQIDRWRILLLSTLLVLGLLSTSSIGTRQVVAVGLTCCYTVYGLIPRFFGYQLHTGSIFRLVDHYIELLLIASALFAFDPLLYSVPLVVWVFLLMGMVKGRLAGLLGLLPLLFIAFLSVYLVPSPRQVLLVLLFSSAGGFLLLSIHRQSVEGLEAELSTQELQIRNKNKLLSTLSHELRTPLTVIQTSTEILQEQRPGPVNETQRRFLDSTHANVRRMIRLVENILAQIKVEHTLFSLEKRTIDTRVIIRRVIRNMDPFLEDQGQKVRYTFDTMVDPVKADDKWIEQVLINLIHNASKHIGQKGTILIALKQNEQCQIISVSDNGSGIDREERPKIFSEFYQGKDAENDINDGVGLGLAIVRDIIEKHGGKVYISSVQHQGTTISFTLPLGEGV